MNYIERLNTLPATAQEKVWLEERLANARRVMGEVSDEEDRH